MLLALAAVGLAQEPTEEPRTVELVYRETLPWPAGFDGERPHWQTNRYGQVLLVAIRRTRRRHQPGPRWVPD